LHFALSSFYARIIFVILQHVQRLHKYSGVSHAPLTLLFSEQDQH
jgi:hypothetical protein